MQVLLILNNSKDLGLSYKTDLDFWIVSEGKKISSYNQRNMVLKVSYIQSAHDISKLRFISDFRYLKVNLENLLGNISGLS